MMMTHIGKMEQKLINQFTDDLECLKKDAKNLREFQNSLESFNLPSDIKRKIEFEVVNEINNYGSEIEQLEIDLNFEEEEEARADLEMKYQEHTRLEE